MNENGNLDVQQSFELRQVKYPHQLHVGEAYLYRKQLDGENVTVQKAKLEKVDFGVKKLKFGGNWFTFFELQLDTGDNGKWNALSHHLCLVE